MKYQVLFSLKTMKKYSRLLSAAVVIGAYRVNHHLHFGSHSEYGYKRENNK